jgi:hypothetical protein
MDFDYSFYKMMCSKAKASVLLLLLLEESHDQPLNQDKCIDVIA